MQVLEEGNRVRVDIPNEDDPDFRYHRARGEIVDVYDDDAGQETGDSRDSRLYRVRLDEKSEEVDFRWRDLRPLD